MPLARDAAMLTIKLRQESAGRVRRKLTSQRTGERSARFSFLVFIYPTVNLIGLYQESLQTKHYRMSQRSDVCVVQRSISTCLHNHSFIQINLYPHKLASHGLSHAILVAFHVSLNTSRQLLNAIQEPM